ncbi:MAG: DUF1413 domain-containing protein [Sphaerochaeta sp.]
MIRFYEPDLIDLPGKGPLQRQPLGQGDRLLLGSLFLSYVGRNDSDLTVINKGASGQQMYQKTRRADPKG